MGKIVEIYSPSARRASITPLHDGNLHIVKISLYLQYMSLLMINNLIFTQYGRKKEIRETRDAGGTVEIGWRNLRQ